MGKQGAGVMVDKMGGVMVDKMGHRLMKPARVLWWIRWDTVRLMKPARVLWWIRWETGRGCYGG
jgi:hypothetical protein